MRFLACLLALGLVAAIAVQARAEDEDTSASWLIALYGEGDDEGGLGLAFDATWLASERTHVYAGATYADTTTNISGLSTRGFDVGFYHDTGPVALDLWYDDWADPDVLEARSFNGSFDVHAGRFTISLLGQARSSDFEPFATSATVILRNGQQVLVEATADCDLDNTGLGLRIAYHGERWRGYARAMGYDYDQTDCRFDSAALDFLQQTRPEVFRQFAARITAPLSVSATTHIGADNALLEQSWATGAGYDSGRVDYGIDYTYQEDHFNGLTSDTVSGTLGFEAGVSTEVFVTIGMTDGDALDSVLFGGLGLRTLF